ncbi:MAG: hypothetical protein H7232_04210 [Aeromicrobium sp.]|nr:hypothetical protein [Burkholderiales bacterium]
MNRRRQDFQEIDTSTWPTVDVGALPAAPKKAFIQHQESVDLFASGAAVRDIEEQTGIDRRQLYRLLA